MVPKRVAIIASDWPEYEKYCPNWLGLKRGFERLGIPYKFFSSRPKLNLQEVVDYKPDFILLCLMECLIQNQDKELRKQTDAPIVFWFGDYRDSRVYHHFGDHSDVDAMFVSNDAQEQYWKEKLKIKKVFYLPLGCEPVESVPNSRYDFPFIFVGGVNGGAYYERALFINKLREEEGLIIINGVREDLRAKIFKAMPSIYSSAKVVLDVSHFPDVKGYTSNRFWNIPAMHGFALTKRWPGCTDYYPEDTRAYFDTYEECVEKKNYYLNHEDKRKIMAEKAYKHSFNHTYDKRLTIMFSKL